MSPIAADHPRQTFPLKSVVVGEIAMVGKVEPSSTLPITQIVRRRPSQTRDSLELNVCVLNITLYLELSGETSFSFLSQLSSSHNEALEPRLLPSKFQVSPCIGHCIV